MEMNNFNNNNNDINNNNFINQMYFNNMNMNLPNINNINNINQNDNMTMNYFNNNANIINNNNNNFISNQNGMNNMNNFANINQNNIMNNINFNNNIDNNNNININDKMNDNNNSLLQQRFDVLKFSNMLEQVKKCTCVVSISNLLFPQIEKIYTKGFFCKVLYKNKKHKLLMIYTNVELNQFSKIECYFPVDTTHSISLFLYDQKNVYLNKNKNLLIVEINNNLDVDFFYEYDLDNFNNDSDLNNVSEKGNLLYLLSSKTKNYPNFGENPMEKMEFSFGILNELTENEINISFNYSQDFLGSPIVNMNNNKLIGILSSSNRGITIKYILSEYFMNKNNNYFLNNSMLFSQMNNMMNLQQMMLFQQQQTLINILNNKNMIKIKVEVDKNEIKREIRFINKLEDIDKNDIDIFINGIKADYQNHLETNKEGIYCIKLIFKKNIKNCSRMFEDCENIIEIDLSCFDTRNVTDMKMMFSRCIHLKEIDLTNFNTENVISMESMFNECYKLKHLNISSFNTKKVENMYSMFAYTGLNYLDISSFDFDNNCDITNIIGGSQLKTIKMKKNNEIEKQLYQYIQHFNGKIIIV